MKRKQFIILLLIWGFGTLSVFGQTATIDKFQLKGDTIVVGYNLEGPIDSFYTILPMIVQRRGGETTTFFPNKEMLFELQSKERIGATKSFLWLHEGLINEQNFDQFEMRIFTKNAGYAPIIVQAKPKPKPKPKSKSEVITPKEEAKKTPKPETAEYVIIDNQFQLIEKKDTEVPENSSVLAEEETPLVKEVIKKEKKKKLPNRQVLFAPTYANPADEAWGTLVTLAAEDSIAESSNLQWDNINNFNNRPTYVPVNETSIVESVIEEEVIEIEEEEEEVKIRVLSKKQRRIKKRLYKKEKRKTDKAAKKYARKNKERPIRDLFKKVEKSDEEYSNTSKGKYSKWRKGHGSM